MEKITESVTIPATDAADHDRALFGHIVEKHFQFFIDDDRCLSPDGEDYNYGADRRLGVALALLAQALGKHGFLDDKFEQTLRYIREFSTLAKFEGNFDDEFDRVVQIIHAYQDDHHKD